MESLSLTTKNYTESKKVIARSARSIGENLIRISLLTTITYQEKFEDSYVHTVTVTLWDDIEIQKK